MPTGLWPVDAEVVFFRDERWVEKDQVMVFTAEVKGKRIPCSLTEEVLKVHFASERVGRFQAFRENRQQIEEIAGRTLQPGLPALKLGMSDFTEAADFIPWER
jgi:hypothetical protein